MCASRLGRRARRSLHQRLVNAAGKLRHLTSEELPNRRERLAEKATEKGYELTADYRVQEIPRATPGKTMTCLSRGGLLAATSCALMRIVYRVLRRLGV